MIQWERTGLRGGPVGEDGTEKLSSMIGLNKGQVIVTEMVVNAPVRKQAKERQQREMSYWLGKNGTINKTYTILYPVIFSGMA